MSESEHEQMALPSHCPDDPREALTPDTPVEQLPTAAHDLPPSYPPLHRPRPVAVPRAAKRRKRGWVSTLVMCVLVVALAAAIKTFVVQWFEIPSESMEDTLQVGDRVAVTMYDAKDIQRGDVVVFRDPANWLDVTDPTGWRGAWRSTLIAIHLLPQDSGHHLIKRVIGLSGDHVSADGSGPVTVNGVALKETYLKAGRAPSDRAFDVVVPANCLWVMGDNRSNSADSRYHQDDPHGGCVPMEDVVGVAQAVVWPIGSWASLDSGRAVFKDVPNTSDIRPTSGPSAQPSQSALPTQASETRTLPALDHSVASGVASGATSPLRSAGSRSR